MMHRKIGVNYKNNTSDSDPCGSFPSAPFSSNIDGLIVLGARLNPQGEPGRVARMRLIHALHVWRQCSCQIYMILTGGRGHGCACSEARAMAGWALSWVSEHWGEAIQKKLHPCLILEEISRTTAASARHTLPLVQAQGTQAIGLVSDSLHILRANQIFQRHFRPQGIIVHPLPARGLVRHYWRNRRFLGLGKMAFREGGAWLKALASLAFQTKDK